MATASELTGVQRISRPLLWVRYLLGFGLGGIFDGILLHQVLQ